MSLTKCVIKRMYSAREKMKTAGILVIGDEILKGDVLDTNSNYVSKKLHHQGIHVQKISVVGDIVPEIAEEVKHFSKTYDYVITTGGIGPTHDDVTFEAIGKAFGECLEHNSVLVKLCSSFYDTDDINSPGMKLALIPKSAELTFPTDTTKPSYPNIRVNNVYIFPGIPPLFQKSIDALAPILFTSGKKYFKKTVFFNVPENSLCGAMDAVVKKYPSVSIGSYPELYNENYKVRVTLESCEEESTKSAYSLLVGLVPTHYIVRDNT